MANTTLDLTNIKNPTQTSNSWSGLGEGPARTGIENTLGQLTGKGMGGWDTALSNASQMPGQIQGWTSERIKNQRLGADDWANAMGSVAKQRTNQGILGGSESNNLRGNVMSRLIGDLTGRQDQIMAQGNQNELATRMSLPGMYGQQMSLMPQLGGLLKEGTSSAYAEDPAAMLNAITKLIIAGYTG